MSESASRPADAAGLAAAVAERALVRTARGAAVGGFALGVLALAFLVIADGTVDARSLPQLLILGFGQAIGLALAWVAALAVRRARAGADAAAVARQVGGQLSRCITVLAIGGAVIAVACLATLRPFTLAALSVVLSLAILAQFVIVLVALRGRLRRAVRA